MGVRFPTDFRVFSNLQSSVIQVHNPAVVPSRVRTSHFRLIQPYCGKKLTGRALKLGEERNAPTGSVPVDLPLYISEALRKSIALFIVLTKALFTIPKTDRARLRNDDSFSDHSDRIANLTAARNSIGI